MRIESLLTPGQLSMGIRLRTEAAKAISAVEIFAAKAGGTSGSATVLYNFFTDCATKLATLRDTVAPTVSTRTQPTGGNTITLTMSEPLDARIIPDLTSFVTAPVRTITGVAIDGTKVLVTYSGVSLANGNTIAYTQPGGANKLQDSGGNLVATFAAAAITVA